MASAPVPARCTSTSFTASKGTAMPAIWPGSDGAKHLDLVNFLYTIPNGGLTTNEPSVTQFIQWHPTQELTTLASEPLAEQTGGLGDTLHAAAGGVSRSPGGIMRGPDASPANGGQTMRRMRHFRRRPGWFWDAWGCCSGLLAFALGRHRRSCIRRRPARWL